MTRFYGVVGYGEFVESVPGVSKAVIVEKSYRGDVLRTQGMVTEGEQLNREISLQNSISIVADAYAFLNFTKIKYVTYLGMKWRVSSIEVQSPRLILRLGEVYNGNKTSAPDTP